MLMSRFSLSGLEEVSLVKVFNLELSYFAFSYKAEYTFV